jgi:hypothetical protein
MRGWIAGAWIAGLALLLAGVDTAVWGNPDASKPDADVGAPTPELSDRSAPSDRRPMPSDPQLAAQGSCPATFEPWVPAIPPGGPVGERLVDCLRRLPRRTDSRVPLDQRYDLTTFGGPGEEQPTYCEDAPDADGTWFYAANAHRFGCGPRFRLVNGARTRCVIVQVADLGPHICVEAAGGRPAWDVSPLVSRHLYGVRSSGWSEHREVFGAPVAPGNPLGPCRLEPTPGERGSFIGGPCRSDADCALDGGRCLREEEGWPGGHCTSACLGTCPMRDGPYPISACTAVPGGDTTCLSRCDFTLFATGCRAGYVCSSQSTPEGPEQQVCVPSARCEG